MGITKAKNGQITVFIIIGLIIIFVIGTVLYLSRTQVTKEFEAVRPAVSEIPQQVQPLRDLVESCILRLGTDGLRRIGDSGGYIDTAGFNVNPIAPTDGEAIEFSPGAGPKIVYWWHMKSENDCKKDCAFDTLRPGLYRSDGGNSIESQLDKYATDNLRDCLGNFEDYVKQGCQVQELGQPKVTANIAEEDVFFVGKYPLRALCGSQTFDVEDSYVSIPLNLKEIYNLATELTNFENENRILEQTTKNIIYTFSEVDTSKLPPPRALNVGPPQPGTFWIKFEVLKKLKGLLTSYIPLIQPSSVLNYNYIAAPRDARDPEAYELMYNRQFFIPLNSTHPTLEAHFMYLDWWEPYFDLNCNGQLCQADSGSNFFLIPFTINRYQFAYDLSYPVLVEVRNPSAFNNEGYSFKFMLEQNMRNSDAFSAETQLLPAAASDQVPSIFCNPEQQTSGDINIYVKDGKNLKGLDEATISYLCGRTLCNLGMTAEGNFTSKFPRCIGGTLRVTKQGYASYSAPMDVIDEEPMKADVLLEPVRYFNVTIKNYAITKSGKSPDWAFKEFGLLRPPPTQTAVITLVRNGTIYDEPYTTAVELTGAESGELALIPGNYKVRIMSFLKGIETLDEKGMKTIGDLVFPADHRCIKYKKGFKTKKKCYDVPTEPLVFNQTSPFPYGGADYDYTFTTSMLRGNTRIEFRQFVMGIDKVAQNNRVIEDLDQINKVKMYATSEQDRINPVIS